MKKFIFITRDYDVLVISENEEVAKIRFSQEYPSLRAREIKETTEDTFIL